MKYLNVKTKEYIDIISYNTSNPLGICFLVDDKFLLNIEDLSELSRSEIRKLFLDINSLKRQTW